MKLVKAFLKTILQLPFGERWNKSILVRLGVKFRGNKDSVWISNCRFVGGSFGNLSIGEHSHILDNSFILLRDKVIIGNNVGIAYGVSIITSSNPSASPLIQSYYHPYTAPVTIHDNVWVGANATILPGVTIGECSIVAAGALVNKDVPPYSVVAGIPAKVIKRLTIG